MFARAVGAARNDRDRMTSDPLWLAVTLALTVTLLAIAIVDLRSFRIPDVLSLPLAAVGLLLAWGGSQALSPGTIFADHLIGASVAYLLFAALGEVIHRRSGLEALGLGDAKLFAAAGAWLGWQALPQVLLIASVGGLGYALIVRRRHGPQPIAFGPWIALGFLSVWLARGLT